MDATNKTKYSIIIKTGNKMNAGTDSNVILSIYGNKSSLQSIPLDMKISTKSKKNLFEKGSIDEFETDGNDVGKVRKFKIFGVNIKILYY